MRTKKRILILLLVLSSLGFVNCDAYNDLYGTGGDDKNDKKNCNAAAALYLTCSNENPGYANTACSSQYLLAVASCGYGGGSGGGGGGGY
ncbi:hypothetical protein EHQ52_02090 [Leptospira koniambonensis]|uniref:Lipoprotein n=1 Tax=Leptospira koniambonensis TaxID=2484950 RepID=A0A4R9JBF4_9LEPT|nr:hypothetical protein [Leptospira koniambonensis]TGL36690.1 hypothetical protein EHQ52_02090 [Leptospira koniambonensis]